MKTIEAVQCEHCKKLHPKENIYDYVIVIMDIIRNTPRQNVILACDNKVYCNQCLAKAINKALDLYNED